MNRIKKLVPALLIFLAFCACETTDVVESGIYSGTIDEVEAAKTEIYVKTAEGQTLELYFTDETSLSRAGEVVDFSMLKEGMAVEVEVEKVGKRLDPISVEIME